MPEIHLEHWLTIITMIGGAAGWYITVRLNRAAARAQHTFDALREPNFDPLYQQHLSVVRPYLYAAAGTELPVPAQEVRDSIVFLLNYYEFLAAALRRGVLSESLFRDDQAGIVRHLYKYAAEMIATARHEQHRPALFQEVEWLHWRWNSPRPWLRRLLEWVLTRPLYRPQWTAEI